MSELAAPSAAAADAASAPARKDGTSLVWRVLEALFPFVVVLGLWEITAHAGVFPARLFPTLETVGNAFWRLAASGALPQHVAQTMVRLLAGFCIAAVIGVVLGILMGRIKWVEDMALPIVSIGAPIPGLAYAPIFLMWFGLGNMAVILLVAVVATFPIVLNTWTGVKAVKEIWVRSAQAMGASDRSLFARVILPGALPYIMTGLRLGLAQAWRILVGVEMLAAVPWGLGWMIFGAREFLATDIMLAGIAVIGIIGLILEKLVFQRLENATVVRWGMVTA